MSEREGIWQNLFLMEKRDIEYLFDLRKLAEDLYPEEKNGSGWYRKVYYDLWIKYRVMKKYTL